MARFFSGGDATYQQAPRKYSFDWRPAEIEWFGDRGENFVYNVQDALNFGAPDFTQCLPADLELRLNLWNLYGTGHPTDMADNHMVEVVIDGFDFEPNGLTEVPIGGTCSKHCQCGETARCRGNVCTSVRKLEEDVASEHSKSSLRATGQN